MLRLQRAAGQNLQNAELRLSSVEGGLSFSLTRTFLAGAGAGQRSTEPQVCEECGDDDDGADEEDKDDGGVDGQSRRLTPAVNHSLPAVSPPAAAPARSVNTPPAAAKAKEPEGKERQGGAGDCEGVRGGPAVCGGRFPFHSRRSVEAQLNLSASSVSV